MSQDKLPNDSLVQGAIAARIFRELRENTLPVAVPMATPAIKKKKKKGTYGTAKQAAAKKRHRRRTKKAFIKRARNESR